MLKTSSVLQPVVIARARLIVVSIESQQYEGHEEEYDDLCVCVCV